jgi:hypothetical protein
MGIEPATFRLAAQNFNQMRQRARPPKTSTCAPLTNFTCQYELTTLRHRFELQYIAVLCGPQSRHIGYKNIHMLQIAHFLWGPMKEQINMLQISRKDY